MIRSFKILSLLLSYPTEEIAEAASSFDAILAEEGLLKTNELEGLAKLTRELASADIYDLQTRYISLFDRSRTLSLHIFEHIHGEARDRGQAMVDLIGHYETHGFEISHKELPDFVPLFLEFLSLLPLKEARNLLSEPLHIIAALKTRLRKRDSDYGFVFQALEAIAGGKANAKDVEALLAEPDDDPDDLDALDAIWQEAEVTFGPGPDASAACGTDRLGAQIRAGMRPPPADPSSERKIS